MSFMIMYQTHDLSSSRPQAAEVSQCFLSFYFSEKLEVLEWEGDLKEEQGSGE